MEQRQLQFLLELLKLWMLLLLLYHAGLDASGEYGPLLPEPRPDDIATHVPPGLVANAFYGHRAFWWLDARSAHLSTGWRRRFDALVPLRFDKAPGTFAHTKAPACGESIPQKALALVLVLAVLVAVNFVPRVDCGFPIDVRGMHRPAPFLGVLHELGTWLVLVERLVVPQPVCLCA